MVKRLMAVVGVTVAVGALAPALSAEPEASGPVKVAAAQFDAARVDALLDMPSAERREYLKGLDPDERRGLWFEVQKAKHVRRGQQPATRGSGMTPHAVAPQGSAALRPKAVGTIQYDSGAFSTSFGGGAIVGNRFDTHTGLPVFASGTVDTVQAVVIPGAANTTSSAGFVLLGPQTGGGGAMAIFSSFTGATGATDTVTFAGMGANYIGSSFFVLFGDFANSYIPVFGTGTSNGQGHHGVVGYTGGTGPNITGTFDFGGAYNSFIRATGNIVPVELMSFEAE